ncbi:hypothetical protein B0H19DRAFT_1191664 [Mycena capillaripes]|nr:hypothetical protein B0H19DRAFT_1191664 [Mycena capillaripes]
MSSFPAQFVVASAACLVIALLLMLSIRALFLQGLINEGALDDPDTRPKLCPKPKLYDAFLDYSGQGGSPLWHHIMPITLQPLECCPQDAAKHASIDMSASTSAPAPALYAVGFLIAMPVPPLYPPLVSPSPDTSCSPNDGNDQWLEIGIADVVVPSQ